MKLSEKQWKIIRLVSEGLKNKEIAPLVGTTEHVVKNYVRTIYDETGMNNRTELALWYVSREEKERYETQSVVTVNRRSHVDLSGASPSCPAGIRQTHHHVSHGHDLHGLDVR